MLNEFHTWRVFKDRVCVCKHIYGFVSNARKILYTVDGVCKCMCVLEDIHGVRTCAFV